VQLGFVIDQSRCIGCHACTVACKSENDVPVGDFRTWVKYTEAGEFPQVKRSFAVLRCNQCTAAPCMTICPTRALNKRPDGIVDVDPAACIGCKSCMQGCPYDALYIGGDGTAEKCHFCAHRTERGLAPACAVVCPTEAIVPGDFDDPESIVSRMKRDYDLASRKPEAGTGPNVLYRDAEAACLDPTLTTSAGGHMWADRHPEAQVDVEAFRAMEEKARARTTYDVEHPPLWGWKITGYLFAKSIAAGVFLVAGLAAMAPIGGLGVGVEHGSLLRDAAVPLLGLAFLTITSVLLVSDLKRPERFFYILVRPNWSSWLVRGTWALMAYGILLSVWAGLALASYEPIWSVRWGLFGLTGIAGALAACYTGWLFGQAKGRVLWMRRGLWAHLIVQAMVAGAATLLLVAPLFSFGAETTQSLARILAAWLGLHAAFTLVEGRLAPERRESEYGTAHALVVDGPFSRRHWRVGVVIGIVVPLLVLALPASPWLVGLASLLALVGLYSEEDVLVRAGQALSIS
jgi:Fe-S-cluster-containing dehydrogenase component/formate-dependent nitrite reductase membrane component NrfD